MSCQCMRTVANSLWTYSSNNSFDNQGYSLAMVCKSCRMPTHELAIFRFASAKALIPRGTGHGGESAVSCRCAVFLLLCDTISGTNFQ